MLKSFPDNQLGVVLWRSVHGAAQPAMPN
jgi:hypothetical protein